MKKKIFSVLIAVVLAFSMLSLAACPKKPSIEIKEPEGGYQVTPGGTIEITVTEPPMGGLVTFGILSGGEHVEELTNGGSLTVMDGGKAIVGKTIKIEAVLTVGEDVYKDTTTVTISHIQLSAINNFKVQWEDEMYPGETAWVKYDLVPANTTQDDVTVEIMSGPASIVDGKIKVPENAQSGEIKVRVMRGQISSEIKTIDVVLPTNDPHYLSSDTEQVTLENRGGSAQGTFTIRVNNSEGGAAVTDAVVTFSVTAGSQFLSINPEGYTCRLTMLGHGEAEVTAKLRNGKTYPVPVTCIKTPSRLDLPEYMLGKNNIKYTVAKDKPFDFAAVVPSSGNDAGSCKDVKYTFQDNVTKDVLDSSVYESGKITFGSVGEILVTATSNSGNSNGEASFSRVFIVNEGVNVGTWEELQTQMANSENTGKNINIVATRKVDGDYNLVPRVILDKVTNKDSYKSGVTAVCEYAVSLNGNGHAIDLEKLKYNPLWSDSMLGDVLLFRSPNDGADAGYDVNIKDLIMYGNVNIDGKNLADTSVTFPQPSTNGDLVGIHEKAINIGNNSRKSFYNVNIENVKIYNFNIGIGINRARPGSKCSNIEMDDCFKSAFNIGSSIVELNNLTLGSFGSFCIEPILDKSNEANDGQDVDTHQKITLTGETKVASRNGGDTKYFMGYSILGNITLPVMIEGLLTWLQEDGVITPERMEHVRTDNGEYAFFMFMFTDPTITDPAVDPRNYTEMFGDSNNEIVNATSITGTNTTAKFIEMDMGEVNIPGAGKVPLGKIVFYNLKYQPPAPTI